MANDEKRWSEQLAHGVTLAAGTMSDDDLKRLYYGAWERVKELFDVLEPVLLEQIARVVREHIPDATRLVLEPTDQGGPGWVLSCSGACVHTTSGRIHPDDGRGDALHDDDRLHPLLSDFGEFVPSDDHDSFNLELPVTVRRT